MLDYYLYNMLSSTERVEKTEGGEESSKELKSASRAAVMREERVHGPYQWELRVDAHSPVRSRAFWIGSTTNTNTASSGCYSPSNSSSVPSPSVKRKRNAGNRTSLNF